MDDRLFMYLVNNRIGCFLTRKFTYCLELEYSKTMFIRFLYGHPSLTTSASSVEVAATTAGAAFSKVRDNKDVSQFAFKDIASILCGMSDRNRSIAQSSDLHVESTIRLR